MKLTDVELDENDRDGYVRRQDCVHDDDDAAVADDDPHRRMKT